jgi:RNA polymerase sigma-70 factor (ECF subfamily)
LKPDDRELIKRLKKSATKEQAFSELVRTYQKPLYAHIRRMVGNHEDADDLLQNTLVKVWQHVDGFKGDAAIFTWMYRIATNETLGFLRSQKHTSSFSENESLRAAVSTDGPDGGEITRRLNAALHTLPPKQRQVFDLKYFGEMKYEDIAEITGTSIGALKASYFHAVKKIESILTA